ncbi:MAG: hypothetical protein ACOX4M_05830 [Acetivibrionales bacterium]
MERVKELLAILSRYKAVFIILFLLVLAVALIWMIFTVPDKDRIPSKGVFVINRFYQPAHFLLWSSDTPRFRAG